MKPVRANHSFRKRAARPQGGAVTIELLEERTLFSLVIAPVFGAEKVTYYSTRSQASDPDLFVILWGSYWQSLTSAQSKQIETATQDLVATPFLGETGQYGTVGKATLGNGKVSFVYDDSTQPPSTVDFSIILNEAKNVYSSGKLPTPGFSNTYTPDYIVVTPPTVREDSPDVAGFNATRSSSDGTAEHAIWSETTELSNSTLSVDDLTDIVSHEIAESMTNDYGATGNAYPYDSSVNQICDGEAEAYQFRESNGVLVQSDWSNADGAFAIDNGTALDFDLAPQWSGDTFSGKYALTVNAAQPGASSSAVFVVGTNSNGGVTVSLDGQASIFSENQITSVTLETQAGANKIELNGTLSAVPVTIQSRGNDTVDIVVNKDAANLHGNVAIQGSSGSTAAIIDDTANPDGSSLTLDGNRIAGIGSGFISFSPAFVAPVTIEAGKGTKVMTVSAVPYEGNVQFVGGPDSNTLYGPLGDNQWNITGHNSGTVDSVAFSDVQDLEGNADADVFSFYPGGNISGDLAGGGGADWLDYSNLSTRATVNLASGVASGTGGISGIENVRAGSGGSQLTGDLQPNVLVGGAGNDSLIVGSGRSILIGAAGTDTLTAGSGGDILIGGYTSFDDNNLDLLSILQEWQSADAYSTRVADITNGGGSNETVELIFGKTVIDDGAANTLTGGSGMDWFFKGDHDSIKNAKSGEQIN